MENYDIALVSMPVMETKIPPAAIYYLKGQLEKQGIKTRCFNLVRDMADHFLAISKEKHIEIQMRLLQKEVGRISGRLSDANKIDNQKALKDALLAEDPHRITETEYEIKKYFDDYIRDKIKPLNVKWIGLSIFTFNSRVAGKEFAKAIRRILPDVKIILGGIGVLDSMAANGTVKHWGQIMVDKELADYYISGEGELALVELLNGNENYPGINKPYYKQIDDLDALEKPDYSDYAVDYGQDRMFYDYKRVFRRATITGSRGCVRACTFCDIGAFWKKFRYRSGKSISDEMIHLNKEWGVQNVVFSDSLINGSMKAFRDLNVHMADYHNNLTGKFVHKQKIYWGGQFIVRSEKQCPEADYELMRQANLSQVAIGIESASENVRTHMEKGYSNADMYYCIDQLIDKGVMVDLMFIVGYPTETEEDFNENIKFLEYYADRIIPRDTALEERRGGIFNLNLGDTASILEGTPLWHMKDKVWKPTELFHTNYTLWESAVVPGLDIGERVRRRRILTELINDLGYDAQWDKQQMANLEKNYKQYANTHR